MAFTLNTASTGSANIQVGPELEIIRTESLAFLALSGESKFQLLPSPWPSDNLPPPTASLMSIASRQGLIAAAGPDTVILATTESVRKAFEGSRPGEGNLKTFQPQLKLSMSMRISQLTFTADEAYLVLSAENGGGLRVYDVKSLLQGSVDPVFDIATQGLALRALVPNPTPERGELLALVTTDGKLMIANLKEMNLVQGPNGQVLKDGVSCVSWSTKGKQLVAGLGDCTAYQLTPEGQHKADIPKPPGIGSEYYMSSLTWLENDVFLFIYTPTNSEPGHPPHSAFRILTRKSLNFTFQEIQDPTGPFGLNRSPPHHFLGRLRDFPPSLKDVLIVASSASADIGLFSRSKVPLTSEKLAESITDVFTTTEMADDSKRAQLPINAELNDTSPIGLALDLSSREKVTRPIPADEIDESPTPLPALMVLNNEGILASWWLVYNDSIRNGTVYPSLVVAQDKTQNTQSAPISAATNTTTFGTPGQPVSGRGTSSFGASSAISKGPSVWGNSSEGPRTSSGPAFGSPANSGLAARTTSAFGAPAFGTTSTLAFGTQGLPGNRNSPWASANATSSSPTFGQASGLGNSTTFGATAAPSGSSGHSSGGGFGKFASQGGFAAHAQTGSSSSVFGSAAKPTSNIFGGGSGLGGGSTSGAFGAQTNEQKANPFASGFILGSTFQPVDSDKAADTSNDTKGSFFGSGFGARLEDAEKTPAQAPVSAEADMDAMEDVPKPETSLAQQSTTPTTTPASQRSQMFTTNASIGGGLFGAPSTTPADSTLKSFSSATFSFGNLEKTEAKAEDIKDSNTKSSTTTPPLAEHTSTNTEPPLSPRIKEEPPSDAEQTNTSKALLEAPLPPDSMSKARFDDSSNSSCTTDAPLPPDFVAKLSESTSSQATSEVVKVNASKSAGDTTPLDIRGPPEEDGDESGFATENDEQSEEGSGEDVTKDLSPTSETAQTPGFTPQSSSVSALFTKVEKPSQPGQQRSLFGEVGSSAQVLPPPKIQASPRSPSPVRNVLPSRMLRPESSRSVSAPGVASQLLGSGKISKPAQNTYAASLEQAKAEERRLAGLRARKEAEETRSLVDDADEMMQRYLSEEVKPTRTLDEFIGHSDYTGHATNNSIPSQVEAVYRDINSMIDTLGVNAKALKSFMIGHMDEYKDEGRTIEDLEDEEDWCLVEIENLSSIIESDLTQELKGGSVQDVEDKLEACDSLQKDLARLWTKYEEAKKIVSSQHDPKQLESAHAQPLTSEEAAQQNDLRREFTNFQKLLCEAEENLTILKAKLSSQATSTGKGTASSGPTVEAVMKTIAKMTSMAEKRSGDVDVLEGQMRKLRFSSVNSTRSREGSPAAFATPQNNRSTRDPPGSSSTYGLFYTPDSFKESGRGLRSSLMSSTSSRTNGATFRKKMSGFTADEKLEIRQKLARNLEVAGKLKAALQKAGSTIRLMSDDD